MVLTTATVMMSECVIIIIARSQQLCVAGIFLEAKSQLPSNLRIQGPFSGLLPYQEE